MLSFLNCTVQLGEFNGFLHNICMEDPTLLKCMLSDEYYRVYPTKLIDWMKVRTVDRLCSNDPHYYQGCGLQDVFQQITNPKKTFCGCMCQTGPSSLPIFLQVSMATHQSCEDWISCRRLYNCPNFVEYKWDDHQKCSENQEFVKLPATRSKVNQDEICNGQCQWETGCEDEAYCNGYLYGMYCYEETNRESITYFSPSGMICGGLYDYSLILAGKKCNIDFDAICQKSTEYCYTHATSSHDIETKLPLLNFTRCSDTISENNYSMEDFELSICADGLDQTNCSDPDRVAGWCLIDGYLSTVSRRITCPHIYFTPVLCDDGIEKECVSISFACRIHKHKLCDQVYDCSDMTDELTEICTAVSPKKCIRKFSDRQIEQTFPVAWINDGIEDCMGGEDELLNWETCGQGPSLRYRRENSTCTEVFICQMWKNRESGVKFIEFEQLCDKEETCQNENKICEVSHSNVPVKKHAARMNLPPVSETEVHFVRSFCLPGLNNVLKHLQAYCETKDFISPTNTFVGRDTYPRLHLLSTSEQECRYLYGEQYVYSSCTGRCKETVCPLTRDLTYSSCPGQYPDRILGLFDQDSLTFVTSRRGRFVNDYFLCENTQCVEYDRVCDLVDNCGDGSDERECSNHFACRSGDSYVAVSQMCDGVTNCFDFSDECNDFCGKEIINGMALKIAASLIGISALVLNLISVVHNLADLVRKSCSKPLFVDKVFTSAIGVGDLMVGVYLLCLSIIDLQYGARYCEFQNEWLTSYHCSALGILSTFGSQLSLFSVTILSLNRMFGVQRSLIVSPEMASPKAKCQVLIFLASTSAVCLAIAVLPLLPLLEDSFVNGLVYERTNRLFNGVVTKEVHLEIFEEVYGITTRFRGDPSWSLIRKLVDSMFSRDYGGIKQKTLHFFGNDGVCLFKYIVKQNDPQRIFVWVTLAINFICVSLTVTSYVTISLVSKSSGEVFKQCSHIDQVRLRRQNLLQRKVTLIVVTDLLCWIPFLIVCLLHFGDVMNAAPLYSLLSIVVLPINSVVNPIFYCNAIYSTFDGLMGWINFQASEFRRLLQKFKSAKESNSNEKILPNDSYSNFNPSEGDKSIVYKNTYPDEHGFIAKSYSASVLTRGNQVVENLKKENKVLQVELNSITAKTETKTKSSLVMQNRLINCSKNTADRFSEDCHKKSNAVKYVCETETVIL